MGKTLPVSFWSNSVARETQKHSNLEATCVRELVHRPCLRGLVYWSYPCVGPLVRSEKYPTSWLHWLAHPVLPVDSTKKNEVPLLSCVNRASNEFSWVQREFTRKLSLETTDKSLRRLVVVMKDTQGWCANETQTCSVPGLSTEGRECCQQCQDGRLVALRSSLSVQTPQGQVSTLLMVLNLSYHGCAGQWQKEELVCCNPG